ncbi:MAG: VOC family protein [Candidatus Saccharimonadales bacterium]
MSVKLNCYLNFNGNAKEALEFYKDIFNATVEVDTFGEFAAKAPDSGMTFTPEEADNIMHASLMGENGIELMIADSPSGMPPATTGSQLTLTLNGDDNKTLQGYWDKLSVEGTIGVPLDSAPWGDKFGYLTDKFGVSWMFNISSPEA